MNNRNENPGCLGGILQLFLINKIYQWGQKRFGTGRGGCCGCLFGAVLFVIFVMVVISVIFGTDWLRVSF